MLTAKTEEADKVAGFAVGADDYLTKPFSLRELAARVKAILRRMERMGEHQDTGPIEHAGLVMDPNRRRVTVDGDDVGLTPLEFEILLTLARDPGVVLSRDQLMDRVWGYRDFAGGPRGRLPRRADPPQARRGRQRATVHPHRARRRVRVPGTVVSSRPLERLPTIRGKLGATIVVAVVITIAISYALIGFALRNSPRDSEAIDALALARRIASGEVAEPPAEHDGRAPQPDRARSPSKA